jgi:FkbM family methyltransferase
MGLLRTMTLGVRLGARMGGPGALHVPFQGRDLRFVLPDLAALQAFAEVFHRGDYHGSPPTASCVLDLGANVGATALFFRSLYPAARIICVEASPQLVPILRENTRGLGVEVLGVAVAPTSGQVTFYESPESFAGGLSSEGTPVTVTAVTMDELLENRPDVVKLDIEGAEFDVVPTATKLRHARVYLGEIHAAHEDERTAELLLAFEGFDVESRGDGMFTFFTAYRRAEPA